MLFEDWIRTQLELRATPEVRLGQSQDGTEVTFMSWSDKSEGTHFWRVVGGSVEHMTYLGSDEPLAAPDQR